MRFFLLAACVLGLFAACSVDFDELKGKNVNGGGDLSVFQIYASKYCTLRNVDDTRTLRVDCAMLSKFLDAGAEECAEHDGFVAHSASFPDKDLPLQVCRDRDNGARQDQERVSFLVFGDVGAGEDPAEGAQQLRVAKAMSGVCPPRLSNPDNGDGSPRCDFALVVGDLIYPRGVDSVWDPMLMSRFEEAYGHFGRFDIFLVPGNHDYLGSIKAQLEYTWFSDRWRMPAKHFAVPDLPSWLHIYGLDTNAMADGEDDVPDNTEEQLAEVRRDLCGKPGWRFLFGHHPPFSNGKHGSKEIMGEKLGKLAEECPFDLYMAGHDHHQEHITTPLFDLLIQGAGGAEVKSVNQQTQPQTGRLGDDLQATYKQMFARSAHGFAVVDATPETVDVRFYDANRWAYSAGVYTDPVSHRDHIYHCRITFADASHACVPVDDVQ